MIFKYIILIYGLVQFFVGAYIWFKKNERLANFLIVSISMLNSPIKYDDIKNHSEFARWTGSIVILWGCTYVFLASASIFFGIGFIMIIILIILIETNFFRIMINGVKNFI